MITRRTAMISTAALIMSAGIPARAQGATLRLSSWLPAAHPVSKFLDKWVVDVAEKTGGEVKIEVYHSGQLGPVTQHYDMVRRGTVDIGFILHAMNPDRFPLAALTDIPFLVKSSVQGTTVLNNSELRSKYLDPEHRGVKVLFLCTNQPAQILTAEKVVHKPEDIHGQRIRFPSPAAKAFLEELGATTVGLPPSAIAENLQKRVIDGLMMDYGGAGVAYKLGGMVKAMTELNIYVTSFGLVMNSDAYARIPAKARSAFDQTLVGVEREIGAGWDSLNAPGKAALIEGGAKVIVPTAAERAPFEAAAAKVRDRILAEREKAGLPARQAYELMQALAKKASA